MNTTGTLFDAGELISRPRRRSAPVDVKVSDDTVTGVGGVVLWLSLIHISEPTRPY